MLDSDLAQLYGVETKQLKRQVRRNAIRFPDDFMFQLSGDEVASLRCQNGTTKGRGGSRYSPFAFTASGIAMPSLGRPQLQQIGHRSQDGARK